MNSILEYTTLVIMTAIVFLLLSTAIINLFYRVPYVPSRQRVVKRILELIKFQKNQHVYDLGCGDARFLINAGKNAEIIAIGYETAPIPFLLAQLNKLLSKSKVKIIMKNFMTQNLGDGDIIYCYLMPEMLTRVGEKLKKECKKGTHVISHTFPIPNLTIKKSWPADKTHRIPSIYMYEI